jgi:hypothetical protein
MIGFAGPDFARSLRWLDSSSPGVDHEELARGVRRLAIGPAPASARNLGGLKMGTTQVHIQETVAPPVRVPVRTLYDFVLEVTVLGLPA